MLCACDLMTTDPAALSPTATLREAVEIMHRLDIRHLPVVNADRELVGMLSDRDLRALTIPYFVGGEDAGYVRRAMDAQVSSLMTSDVLSVEAEADLAEVVDLMLDHKIGAVPVTDAGGVLVGIVSYMDVLRAVPLAEDEDADAAE